MFWNLGSFPNSFNPVTVLQPTQFVINYQISIWKGFIKSLSMKKIYPVHILTSHWRNFFLLALLSTIWPTEIFSASRANFIFFHQNSQNLESLRAQNLNLNTFTVSSSLVSEERWTSRRFIWIHKHMKIKENWQRRKLGNLKDCL